MANTGITHDTNSFELLEHVSHPGNVTPSRTKECPYPVCKYTSLRSMSHPSKSKPHFAARLSKDSIWQISSRFIGKGIRNCKQTRQTNLPVDTHFLHTRIAISFTVSTISKDLVSKLRTEILRIIYRVLVHRITHTGKLTKPSINLSPVSSLHTAQQRVPSLLKICDSDFAIPTQCNIF